MPTYDYECEACDHVWEEFQSITAKPLTTCPECKKKKVKRLISGGAGFIFKGSGFYITDYRSESYKAAAKSDSGGDTSAAPAKSESGAAAAPAKTESKPAANGGAAGAKKK